MFLKMNRRHISISIFRSFDILNPKIFLFVSSIAIQTQIKYEPILIIVSLT